MYEDLFPWANMTTHLCEQKKQTSLNRSMNISRYTIMWMPYVHINICMCMWIHICVYIYIYIHSCWYVYVFIHIYIYIYTYIHPSIHTYIHTYTHTYVHTYVRTYVRTHAHACMHACTSIHLKSTFESLEIIVYFADSDWLMRDIYLVCTTNSEIATMIITIRLQYFRNGGFYFV